MQSTCAIRTRDRRLTATEGSFKIHEMTQDEEIKSALWQKQIIAPAEAVRSQTFEKGHVLPPHMKWLLKSTPLCLITLPAVHAV